MTDYVDTKPRPGRFQGNAWPLAAEHVYEWTLDSSQDEECGTIEYGSGWYALFRFDWMDMIEVLAYSGPEVNAAIVHNTSNGSVHVSFYADVEEANDDFNNAVMEYLVLDEEFGDGYD